jgi:hypothetical protein
MCVPINSIACLLSVAEKNRKSKIIIIIKNGRSSSFFTCIAEQRDEEATFSHIYMLHPFLNYKISYR